MLAILDRVVIGDNDCWNYYGSYVWHPDCDYALYGHMSYKGKSTYTHRIVYEAYHGKIPDGMHVLHRCDNTKCCNPDHLFLGTPKDNHDDAVAKGRKKS
jgi:hypothetical protein